MKKKYIYLLLLLSVTCLTSCNQEESDTVFREVPSLLEVYADIAGVPTRATVDAEAGDQWSFDEFVGGDEMGFFSSGGNYSNGSNGDAPFINQCLQYDGSGTKFTDPDGVQFSPAHMNGNEIYMYYPYSNDITGENGYNLRVKPSYYGIDNDTLRCIDFLDASHLTLMGKDSNDKDVALYGQFDHAFAELIIMRGEGFDNPPEIEGKDTWEIKIVLDQPITGIKVNTTLNPWSCTPEFVWDKTKSRLEASTWNAWLGENFEKTITDPIGTVAWYCIVPTIGSNSNVGKKKPGMRTIVEYIELYDNDGNLQRISSLRLSNANSKYVDAGWRYPMRITMKELVPTANPCNIIPWNGDVDLTDERTRGINNETEFKKFVEIYNEYLRNPDSEETKEQLFLYGDLYQNPSGKNYWHFYVLSDLDLSNYSTLGQQENPDVGDRGDDSSLNTSAPIIPQFKDILDGQSTMLSNGLFVNHTVKGLSSTLVGTLEGEYASIQNFDFISPEVIIDDNSTVGIIANEMNKSSVVNCNIDNGTLYHPDGAGGFIAGIMTDGMVKDCDLSGFLIVSSFYENGIAGEINGNPQFVNNKTLGILTKQ